MGLVLNSDGAYLLVSLTLETYPLFEIDMFKANTELQRVNVE